MAQFCRYCDHMHVTGFGYCDIKDKFYQLDHLAHTNNCELFRYNPIDALRKHRPGHQPYKKEIDLRHPGVTRLCVVRRPTAATRLMEQVREASARIEAAHRELATLEYAMREVVPWHTRQHSGGGGSRGVTSDPTAALAHARIEGLGRELDDKRAEVARLEATIGAGLAAIEGVRAALGDRPADVLDLYYVDCARTWSEVADELGVSRETVRQDRDKALDWIDREGVETARRMEC